MSYSEQHLRETAEIVSRLDPALCEKAVELLAAVRERNGRLFILGVGGSAANASHAVNDFRKICGIEATSSISSSHSASDMPAAGSSSRMKAGESTNARAIQSRCCWPPESRSAGAFSESATSS